jgi:hypothetical protein
MLQRVDGKLIDRIPVRFSAICPNRHTGQGAAHFDLPPDTLTIESFRGGAEAACASLNERCGNCRAPITQASIQSWSAFYEFEDGAGTVVAWYGPTGGGRGWVFGYGDPPAKQYGGIKNEDCRAELGRVFSLRNRWPELLYHYRMRGRTINAEIVAPGYACFVVRRDCTAQVRSLARVLVPQYLPDQTHVHAPVDASLAPGSDDVILEAVIDLDWVNDAISRHGAALDPAQVARDAAARGRMIGEQVIMSRTA